MGPQFKIFLAVFFLLMIPVVWGADTPPQTEQNSDSLEMIAARMRSLTNSLEGMPKPPVFNQQIQLPGDFLPVPQHSTESDNDSFLEKENDQ